MEETNASVPKAGDESPKDESPKGSKAAGSIGGQAAKNVKHKGALVGANIAMKIGSVNMATSLMQKIIEQSASFMKKIFDAAQVFGEKVIGGIQGVFGFGGNVIGAVGNAVGGFFGGIGNAVAGGFMTFCTFAVVTATAVSGGITGTGGVNTVAIIDDKITYEDDECGPNEKSVDTNMSAENGKGGTLTSAELQRNAYIIYTTFYRWLNEHMGSTPQAAENQAYGILANIYRESTYNPKCLETKISIDSNDYDELANHVRGIGLVQWTVYKPEENPREAWISTKIANWFKEKNPTGGPIPWDTLESQLTLLTCGDDPHYGRMKDYIKKSANMTDVQCDVEFLKNYEIPQEEYLRQRENEAKKDIAQVRMDVAKYAESHPEGTDSTENPVDTENTGDTGIPGETDGSPVENPNDLLDDNAIINGILENAKEIANEEGGEGMSNTFEVNEQRARGCIDNSNAASATTSNESIAKAAVSFAWPTKERATGNNGTKIYQTVHDVICKDHIYKACDRAVTCAVGWSGMDYSFVRPTIHGGVRAIHAYLEANIASENPVWMKAGKVNVVDGKIDADSEGHINVVDDSGNISPAMPGDILLILSEERNFSGDHVKIYTGPELIKEMQPKAVPGSNCVAASMDKRSAGCEVHTEVGKKMSDGSYGSYTVYRCTSTVRSLRFIDADKGIDAGEDAGTAPVSSGTELTPAEPTPTVAPSDTPSE